jgi:predicted transcriptional regulator
MLGYMSVQELIDMAVARPVLATRMETTSGGATTGGETTSGATSNGSSRRAVQESEIEYDEDGNPLMELPDAGPAVIRRRADVPDGDLRILRTLADEGPLSEPVLLRATKLTTEQIKLVIRHLRAKGFIHVEGSAQKRKVKITRNGAAHLRKLSRKPR